jgi:hypothetical protein
MNAERTMGRTAFEAYKESVQALTYDSKPIPPWENLSDAVRAAWETAAKAILEQHGKEGVQ